MSTPALTKTTLSAAIDKGQTRVYLASTTGVNGLGSLTTQPSILVVEGEAMLVLAVPISGVCDVQRGYESRAKAHASGANVQHGARNRFSFKTVGTIGLDGEGGTPLGSLPDYQLPLGTEVSWAGKKFVMCDFTATVHTGVVVGISNDGLFTAAPLAPGHQGSVGVVAEQTSSSDTWGWVQVYGACSAMNAQADTSGATSAYIPIIASSVSSPDAGLMAIVGTTSTPQYLIYGMFITGVATTNVTNGGTGGSHTGLAVPVFLNYPYTMFAVTDVGLS